MNLCVPEFLKQRGIKQIIGLDFETYFDTHYTLKKMATSLYIYDDKFETYGVGIDDIYVEKNDIQKHLDCIDWKHTALLCHHTHFDGLILHHHYGINPAYYMCTMSMARPFYKNTTGVALDAISKKMGYAGKTSDILQRTKGRHLEELLPPERDELARYCLQDIREMKLVFNELINKIPEHELDLIDMTIRMFTQPKFGCDVDRISKEVNEQIENRNKAILGSNLVLPANTMRLLKEYQVYGSKQALATLRMLNTNYETSYEKAFIETEKILRSNAKFANELRKAGAPPPMKRSKTTGKMTYAFAKNDVAFQKLENHPKLAVRKLYNARIASKQTTALDKAEKLLELSKHGKIPAYLNYWKAQTGRWTGGDKIQLQNMPRGGEMRRSLTAGDIDSYLCVIDSSGIEMRTLAWLAENENVLNLIKQGKDVYKVKAAEIYDKNIEDITKEERFVGKVAVLGLGYGMSGDKFQITLESGAMGPPLVIERAEAKRIVDSYRHHEYRVTDLWKRAEKWLEAMIKGSQKDPITYKGITFREEHVDLPDGTTLYYPNLEGESYCPDFPDGPTIYTNLNYQDTPSGGRKYIYGGLFVENIVQALARSIVAEQVLNASKHYPCLLMVHDEGVFKIPRFRFWDHEKIISKHFVVPPSWAPDLPLGAEWGSAFEYSK